MRALLILSVFLVGTFATGVVLAFIQGETADMISRTALTVFWLTMAVVAARKLR